MKYVTSIAAALCRVVETLQANPVGGLVLVILTGLAVVGLWTIKGF
ncbi:hypothetical protein [Escherichia coli]|nr:hypothetical protein [Escherichia coli]